MNEPVANRAKSADGGDPVCGRRAARWERKRQVLFSVARCAAALLLVLAATGKAAALARGVIPALLGLASPWWTVVVVLFEGFLAAWLLAAWRQKACRAVAVVVFCVFAVAGLVQALLGHERCGCFGLVQMPIALMVPLNLAVAGSLAVGRPASGPAPAEERPFVARGLVCMAAVLCALPGVAAAAAAGRYLVSGNRHGSLVLTPEGVSGRPAQFLAHVHEGAELARGRWLVLVYRSDCDRCAAALAAFARAAQEDHTPSGQADPAASRGRQVAESKPSRGNQGAGHTRERPATRSATLSPVATRGGEVQYAVLLLPGSGLPAAYAAVLRAFEANATVTWYAVTPLVLELRDGLVQRAEMDVQAALESDTPPGVGRVSTARHVGWFACFTAAGGAAALVRRPLAAQHEGA